MKLIVPGKKPLTFSWYLTAIFYHDFFKRTILNKKTSKEALEGKTQLPGVTNISCKELAIFWVHRSAVLQSMRCSSAQHTWKVSVNQRKLQ